MPSEFRDAIAVVVDPWVTFIASDGLPGTTTRNPDTIARDVLDMPEMEAIRQTLFDLTHPSKWTTADGPRALHAENLRTYDLPESVIAWILRGTPDE